jgi:soluble lytic murein transglycosylase-like protein
MKQPTLVGLTISLSIILIVSSFVNYYYYFQIDIKNKTVADLNNKNKQINLKEKRLEGMTYTLISTYGISKWEAHYYSIIFDDFSQNYKIPWEIYPSIVRIESNFKSSLISPKGAKGMMQLLEGTGKESAEEIGLIYTDKETLWNSLDNLILGCYYLSKNIKSLGLEGGVKSYLGGPGYEKSVAASDKVSKYIGEYKTTVWKEYKLLLYSFRGITAEMGCKYEEVHISSYSDSIKIDTDPFSYFKKK